MTNRVERRVREAIAERKELIDAAIPEELPVERPERLYAASRHLLDAGGKRLRPVVLLLVGESLVGVEPLAVDYRAFPGLDGRPVDLMAAAVSVEVIHLFTLIHDDIMDDDDLRRGVPAVHRAFDLETAILAGDTLYSKAFEILLDAGAPPSRSIRSLETIARTCTQICEGQAFDVGFEGRDDVSDGEYMEMIELKTAVLYGAAASIPAVLLGADPETVEALYTYGIDVGKGFQIQDDVLDLVASSDSLGKQRGSDLVEGKRTLVTIHAADNGIDVGSLVGPDPSQTDLDAAVSRLDEAGSIDHARSVAGEFIERGKAQLEVLPDNEARDRLVDIADFLIERDR